MVEFAVFKRDLICHPSEFARLYLTDFRELYLISLAERNGCAIRCDSAKNGIKVKDFLNLTNRNWILYAHDYSNETRNGHERRRK